MLLPLPEAIARVTVSPAFGEDGTLCAGVGVMYTTCGVGVTDG